MMSLPERFKTALLQVESGSHFVPFIGGEAERLERCAIAAKQVFGVHAKASIEPWEVAKSVPVPIIEDRNDYLVLPDSVRATMLASREWSAGTIDGPLGPMIFLNPIHARTRLKVTLAEELAHLVMGHPPSRIDGASGVRTHDSSVEDEAFSVGGAMVMPYPKMFALAKTGTAIPEIAAEFEVSTAMARCRLNRCGLSKVHRKNVAGSR